jgi:hypothetical protein
MGTIVNSQRQIIINVSVIAHFMKIEQNILQYSATGAQANGYIDLARSLSAVNGKAINQTKRHDGKYKPLGFMVRVRALVGDVTIQTLNCGYPTRNAVVLAGAARDAMLKSAGISRSNLESYQKELRIQYDNDMDGNRTDSGGSTKMYFPGATSIGTGNGGWGAGKVYDYTKLTIVDPDGSNAPISKTLRMLGNQAADDADWDDDTGFYVVDNWLDFRHSFTPASTANDIANNVFSWAMQQSSSAQAIIDVIDDEADEKPYDLTEFTTNSMKTLVGTGVGNPTSAVFCVPLGLMKILTTGSASWEVEVVGVTEL